MAEKKGASHGDGADANIVTSSARAQEYLRVRVRMAAVTRNHRGRTYGVVKETFSEVVMSSSPPISLAIVNNRIPGNSP